MSLSHLPAGQRRKKERGARRWSNHTEASAGRKAASSATNKAQIKDKKPGGFTTKY